MSRVFADREEAAGDLAARLAALALPAPRVVLALPRGGVPIGAIVARRLDARLDLLFVRKIGAAWQPELAVAAVVDGGAPEVVVDEAMRERTGTPREYIDREAGVQWREIERQRDRYLRGRTPLTLQDASVIVVDDGIATGTTMRAALKALRRRGPGRLVLAVPVAPHDTLMALAREVDEVVCLAEPVPFRAVGLHYRDFHAISDEEVIGALDAAG